MGNQRSSPTIALRLCGVEHVGWDTVRENGGSPYALTAALYNDPVRPYRRPPAAAAAFFSPTPPGGLGTFDPPLGGFGDNIREDRPATRRAMTATVALSAPSRR